MAVPTRLQCDTANLLGTIEQVSAKLQAATCHLATALVLVAARATSGWHVRNLYTSSAVAQAFVRHVQLFTPTMHSLGPVHAFVRVGQPEN